MAMSERLHDENIKFRPTTPGTVYQTRMDAKPEPPDSVHDSLPKQFLQRVKTFDKKQMVQTLNRFF